MGAGAAEPHGSLVDRQEPGVRAGVRRRPDSNSPLETVRELAGQARRDEPLPGPVLATADPARRQGSSARCIRRRLRRWLRPVPRQRSSKRSPRSRMNGPRRSRWSVAWRTSRVALATVYLTGKFSSCSADVREKVHASMRQVNAPVRLESGAWPRSPVACMHAWSARTSAAPQRDEEAAGFGRPDIAKITSAPPQSGRQMDFQRRASPEHDNAMRIAGAARREHLHPSRRVLAGGPGRRPGRTGPDPLHAQDVLAAAIRKTLEPDDQGAIAALEESPSRSVPVRIRPEAAASAPEPGERNHQGAAAAAGRIAAARVRMSEAPGAARAPAAPQHQPAGPGEGESGGHRRRAGRGMRGCPAAGGCSRPHGSARGEQDDDDESLRQA